MRDIPAEQLGKDEAQSKWTGLLPQLVLLTFKAGRKTD